MKLGKSQSLERMVNMLASKHLFVWGKAEAREESSGLSSQSGAWRAVLARLGSDFRFLRAITQRGPAQKEVPCSEGTVL